MNGNDIVKYLQSEGFEAYLPTMHTGECTSKYIVVKAQGRTQISGISSSQQMYDMICYVPHNKRSELERFVTDVEHSLIKFGNVMAISTMNERSPDYFDPDVRGHMISTTFKVYYQDNGRF